MRWFFILSSVLACTARPVSSSCPVQMNPPSALVRYGDPFLLNCSSPADQIDTIGLESLYGGSMSAPGNSSVVLKVESVKNWDFGPICFLNRFDANQCSVSLSVTVYKTPDIVSISRPSVKGPLVEGERYSLQCDIVNVAPVRNLSVHWYKGDKILHLETFDGSSRSPVNATSVLNLTAQRGDDETQIWCEAQLDFWRPVPNLPTTKSEYHDVMVLYSPAFVKPENETLEISAGSEFFLDCTAAGKPTPVYSWSCSDPLQPTNQNGNQSVWAPSIQLPGAYECTASNTQGSQTKYFTVIEATRNRTTFAALIAGIVCLGVVICIAGIVTLTPEGTFSCSKGSYL